MKLTVLVNDVQELQQEQTTTMLINEATARGHQVYVTSVASLGLSPDDRIIATARLAPAITPTMLAELKASRAARLDITETDALLIRTNPARDVGRTWAHTAALGLARFARDQGVIVFNDPDGLERASSKLYLNTIPRHYRPLTLTTWDPKAIETFLDELGGPAVLKPLQGTWGRDVFKIDANRSNLHQIIDVLTRQGYIIAQEFISEAVDGDCRLLLLDGRLMEVSGQLAAVRRVPGATDFRSNVHAGGYPAPAEVNDTMLHVVEAVGPRLRADGIFLAGLDFIGGKIVEINAFSPGGFFDAERFSGVRFTPLVIEAIEQRLTQGQDRHSINAAAAGNPR